MADMNASTTQDDWLGELGHDPAVYVIPELRVVYVSVPKNACTSIKWIIADLASENLVGAKAGLTAATSDEDVVHYRDRFSNTRYPDQVDLQTRISARPENGWFIFGLVRDPRDRLFSAWQGEVLVQSPTFRAFRDEEWYPPLPATADGIIDSFTRFVRTMADDPQFPLRLDWHFMDQSALLHWGSVPYSRIYLVNEISKLRNDLLEHLTALGWRGDLEFRRYNDNPLKINASVYPADIRVLVERIYERDFAAFGSLFDFEHIERGRAWDVGAIEVLRSRALRERRIGDLVEMALGYARLAESYRGRCGQLDSRLHEMEQDTAQLDSRLSETKQRAARLDREVRVLRAREFDAVAGPR